MSNDAQIEMPRYRCHKIVHALKIKEVLRDNWNKPDCESDGSGIIVPENARYAEFRVSREYMAKHKPQAGGYYVVYPDGYLSFSPAKAFEDGYSLI